MEIKRVIIKSKYEGNDQIEEKIRLNLELNWEIALKNEPCDYYLSFDIAKIDLNSKATKYILIRREPKIVLPECYKTKFLAKFDQIIDIGVKTNDNSLSVNRPQSMNYKMPETVRNNERIVMIASNLLSMREKELYSLRRKCVRQINSLDLFGFDWDRSNLSKLKLLLVEVIKFIKVPSKISYKGISNYFRNYKTQMGHVENKHFTLAKYKYTLVIENSLDCFSEKLFDALIAGCIPIYVGVDPKSFDIPAEIYISAEPDIDSIEAAIKKAKQIDYRLWRERTTEWLERVETINQWSESKFLLNLKQIIET